MTIEQWGDFAWSSMEASFLGAGNLTVRAPDAPDLSAVTDMGRMFQFASKVNADFNHWDVSSVTNMISMFSNADVFNQDIGGWNVSMVENMGLIFNSNGTFNRNISGWDTGSVTSMNGMFFTALAFNQDLGDRISAVLPTWLKCSTTPAYPQKTTTTP